MSISLYYRFQRDQPLTDEEQEEVTVTLADSGELGRIPLSPDDPPSEGYLLSGSGKPPKDDTLALVLDEWLISLSYLAEELGGSWEVRLDDMIVPWNEAESKFDLSKTFKP